MRVTLAYISKQPFLLGEHAFQLTRFVGLSAAHVTFGGSSGIMSTARPELPYPCISQARSRDKTFRRETLSYQALTACGASKCSLYMQ